MRKSGAWLVRCVYARTRRCKIGIFIIIFLVHTYIFFVVQQLPTFDTSDVIQLNKSDMTKFRTELMIELPNDKSHQTTEPIVTNQTRISELKAEYEEMFKRFICRGNSTQDYELVRPCRGVFYKTVEDNLKFIEQQYPMVHAEDYFKIHNMDQPVTGLTHAHDFNRSSNSSKEFSPVFVTGGSSAFYRKMQAVIKDIHTKLLPQYPTLKFIIYDLGLKENERIETERYCRCEVRRFPFDEYPPHVKNLHTFAWKIFIIQRTVMEFGQMMWMDTSLRFRTGEMDHVFVHAQQHDISIWDTELYFPPTALTDPRMFSYFGEERCLFKNLGQVEAGGVLIFLTNLTLRGVLRPLIACALDPICITPSGSKLGCVRPTPRKTAFDNRNRIQNKDEFQNKSENGVQGPIHGAYRCCHRQDQSAISIILNRLFQYSIRRDIYQPPKLFDFNKDPSNYFQTLQDKEKLNV